MGEVWFAEDTTLNRDVAIKVLPDVFTPDAERVAHFTREALTPAARNRPHIPSAGEGNRMPDVPRGSRRLRRK